MGKENETFERSSKRMNQACNRPIPDSRCYGTHCKNVSTSKIVSTNFFLSFLSSKLFQCRVECINGGMGSIGIHPSLKSWALNFSNSRVTLFLFYTYSQILFLYSHNMTLHPLSKSLTFCR